MDICVIMRVAVSAATTTTKINFLKKNVFDF
jgi:hypothetical protein